MPKKPSKKDLAFVNKQLEKEIDEVNSLCIKIMSDQQDKANKEFNRNKKKGKKK